MRRCEKCVMPETARGIILNGDGLCQLCRDFQEQLLRGKEALLRDVEQFRRPGKDFDCVVPVSGGRDSAYALYYAKEVLGLRPLAVHNDNDFETEIALRNLEEMTRRLAVTLERTRSAEGISRRIVAEKFKMNAPFGPALIVDQTCEACKYGFEAAAYNTARKRGIALVIWGDSKDESSQAYHSLIRGAHRSPGTLRRLLSGAGLSLLKYRYYFSRMKMEYGADSARGLKEIHLYEYIRWDQELIVRTIQSKLGWSVPESSPTTWRVDCKIVPLVNHLTQKAFGVSKLEIGFSNMVRAGKMARDEALRQLELVRRASDVEGLKQFLRGIGVASRLIDRVI